jgi:hypothetical protein
MKKLEKALPSRKSAYEYHVDNVGADPEFQEELELLLNKLESTVAYARHYLTVEELSELGHFEEARLLEEFLKSWRIDGTYLRWRIMSPENMRLDLKSIFCTVEADKGDGMIRLVFSSDINKTEFTWLWRMVNITQAERGVVPSRSNNRFNQENASIAYKIWKKKRAGERIKWSDMEAEYNKVFPDSNKTANSNSLNRLYENYYKAEFGPVGFSLKKVVDPDS